ncbi:MAG: hypothetical protein PVH60_11115, partial [Anaerolineales bacterium]
VAQNSEAGVHSGLIAILKFSHLKGEEQKYSPSVGGCSSQRSRLSQNDFEVNVKGFVRHRDGVR